MRGLGNLALIGMLSFFGACGGGGPGTVELGHAETAEAHADAAHEDHAPGEPAGHAHGGVGEPRDLLPIMAQLGVDMTLLTHGLMTQDTALIARAADAIAHHPPVSQSDIERIQGALADEWPEFERLDEDVHEASRRLHEAVAGPAVDLQDVLSHLHEVQRGCVGCHTVFRERLRTNPVR